MRIIAYRGCCAIPGCATREDLAVLRFNPWHCVEIAAVHSDFITRAVESIRVCLYGFHRLALHFVGDARIMLSRFDTRTNPPNDDANGKISILDDVRVLTCHRHKDFHCSQVPAHRLVHQLGYGRFNLRHWFSTFWSSRQDNLFRHFPEYFGDPRIFSWPPFRIPGSSFFELRSLRRFLVTDCIFAVVRHEPPPDRQS